MMSMKERIAQLLLKLRSNTTLSLIIIAAGLVELVSIVHYNYIRNLLQDELEKRAELELMTKADIIINTLADAESTMEEHYWDLQNNLAHPDSMFAATHRLIMVNPHVEGGCIAFVPNYYPEKGRLFEPYAYKQDGKIKVEQLASEKHDYTQHPAFQEIIQGVKELWSDPYEYGKDQYLTTYTCPLYDKQNRMAAACGLDVNLSWLSDTLNTNPYYPSSFGLLLTQKGTLIAGPNAKHIKKNDVEAVVKLINDSTVERMPTENGKSWVKDFEDTEDHEKASVYFTTISDMPNWQIAIVNYDDEVYAPLYKVRTRNMLMILTGLLVLFFIIHRFAKNEKRLKEAEVEQARIGSELLIARNIQMEMLPTEFSGYSHYVQVAASLEPAKEVGGDLYDYFVRDDKLFFCIGDVSGKGVPAAMLMAVIHSLYRMASSHENNLAHIMQTINEAMCQNNNTDMFVTLFLGMIDLPTGRLRYCNAGHDKPILLRGQSAESMTVKPNLPIGAYSDYTYVMQEGQLMTGDKLFLYTDGITEAKSNYAAEKWFGLEQLKDVLSSQPVISADTPSAVLKQVTEAVRTFVGDTEQNDDRTMLCIHYTFEEEQALLSDSITLRNDIAEVPNLNTFVKSVLAKMPLDVTMARHLRLAVEEAVVNVISYAYPDEVQGTIVVEATANKHRIKFVITDTGIPFDPTEVQEADTSLSAEDRPIGGLGLLLVRELMDTMNYERIDGKNVLTLSKRLNHHEKDSQKSVE